MQQCRCLFLLSSQQGDQYRLWESLRQCLPDRREKHLSERGE